MKKMVSILLCVCLSITLSITVNAEGEQEEVPYKEPTTEVEDSKEEIDETTESDEKEDLKEAEDKTNDDNSEELEDSKDEDIEVEKPTEEGNESNPEDANTELTYTDEEKEAVAYKPEDSYSNDVDFDVMPYGLGEPNEVPEDNTLTVGTENATYATIADALAAITDGAKKTIKLITNITENVTISVKEVILDLFGNTLTSKNESGSKEDGNYNDTIFVKNGSKLTIIDSSDDKAGKVVSASTSSESSALFNNGTVVIEGGTFTTATGNNSYTIVNHGDMTINDGTITRDSSTSTLDVVVNGYNTNVVYEPATANNNQKRVAHVDGVNSSNPTLTINGGTFATDTSVADRNVVIANIDYADLIINGGTFKYSGTGPKSLVLSNYNKTTINGGTFESSGIAVIANNKSNEKVDGLAGELTISGGTFKTTGTNTVLFKNDSVSSVKGNGTITVNGGTYETSNTVSTTDSLTNVVINEATFTNKLDTTGLDKVNIAGATATISTDSSKTYIGNETISKLADSASAGSIITIVSGSANINTKNSNVIIVNGLNNVDATITVNGKVIYGKVNNSSDNTSSARTISCEEYNNSRNWTWSETLGKCVYKVSNSKVD